MSDEHQPEAVWVFPEKKSNKGRIWLIVILAVVAVAIVGVLLFFLLPRDGDPQPTPSPSDSVSASPTPSATVTPSPTTPHTTPSATPTPSETPKPPPPAADPDLATFRDRVTPILDSAQTGLGYAREDGGMSAMQDVMLLQDDAGRLTEVVAPKSIAQQWADGLDAYAHALETLRSTYERGEDAASADSAAMVALDHLNALIEN